MNETDTCTLICPKNQQLIGWWSCIWGQFRGRPTCLDREGDSWRVIWLRPKIVGSFDFVGDLRRGVNCTNATVYPFAVNITAALADTIQGLIPLHFEYINIHVMWVDPGFVMKGWETGFPTLWKTHLFKIEYSLVVWDVNIVDFLYESMYALLNSTSPLRLDFERNLLQSTELMVIELMPNMLPMIFNETLTAPDYSDATVPQQIPSALLVSFLLSGSMSALAWLTS